MTVMGGGSRSNGDYWTWHLQRTDGGQSFAIRDVVGLMGQDMGGWFEQMEAMAAGGRTENYFYHFHLDPREGEAFTPEQLKVAVSTALDNLGLSEQPYFLVEHDKEGRSPHFHCIVLRVDLDSGKAIPDGRNYRVHQRTADQLEQLFGHERTNRERGPDGPNPKGYEVQRGQRTGIDPRDVAAELKSLWHQCDSGQAFAAALEERGYLLSRGDRRDFVVVDQAGSDYALGKRLIGATAAEVRARMASVDKEELPTVSEARALVRERATADDSRDERQRPASPLPAHHQEKHPGGGLQNIVEEVAETLHPRPAEKPPSTPAAEYVPIQIRERSLFERLAQKAADAIGFLRGERTAAESIDPLAQRSRPHPAEVPAPAASPAGFTPTAREFIHVAEEAAPVVEQLAVAAAAVAEHRPAQEELSAFERMTAERFEALRTAPGDGHFTGEGIDWQAREMGTPLLDDSAQGERATPFDRMTAENFAATRDNGGEPVNKDGTSFWSRARAALAEAYEHAAEWVHDAAQTFAGRLLQRRERDRDDHGRER